MAEGYAKKSDVWDQIIAARLGEGHIVAVDADLVARAASPSVYERTGWTPNQLIGMSVLEMIDADDRHYAEIATDYVGTHTGTRPPGVFRLATPVGPIDAQITAEHIIVDGTTVLVYHVAEVENSDPGEGLMLSASQILDRQPIESVDSTLRALTRMAQNHLDIIGCRFLIGDDAGHLQTVAEATSGPAILDSESPLGVITLTACQNQATQRRAAYHAAIDYADPESIEPLRALGVLSTVTAPMVTGDAKIAGFFETFHARPEEPDRQVWGVHSLITQLAVSALNQTKLIGELDSLRSVDDVTSVTSRHGLFAALDDYADRSQDAILLLVDIDGFRWINGTLGSAVGNDVLSAAARRITDALPDTAVVGRSGSDEFAALIPLETEATGRLALDFGRRILQAFDTPLSTHHLRRRISVSVGAAWTDKIEDPDDLIALAGSAASAAKEAGGNTVKLFDERSALEYSRSRRIGAEITRAMKNDELYLDFQPILSLNPRQIVSVEALVRWNHPDWGLVSPNQFVPAVEIVGMAIDLDSWVINEASRWIHRWKDHSRPDFRVWINASGPHFRQPGLATRLTDAIGPEMLHRVGIEISEEAVFSDRDAAAEVISDLREHDVPVALDDFGTGKSSLETLHWIEADTVKIDRSFVTDLTNDDRSGTLVAAMIDLSHGLNARVVAEGVESMVQLDKLEHLGADEIQGFVAFRPLAADKVLPLLNGDEPHLLAASTP